MEQLVETATTISKTPVEGKNGYSLIRLNNITKSYKSVAGEFPVLKGINAEFNPGDFVAVIGKSGSGKSTLINMITGIDRPSSGEVWVGDKPIHTMSENELSIWRGRNMGIVFQFFQLLPMLNLMDNIMLPMDFCQMFSLKERKERAMQLLRLVEMEDHAYKLPSAVSGGQQQRVAIARALANDPPILVADEPTGNLDSRTADSVFQLFTDLIQQGKTIVMVTHDSAIARRVSRTLLIADGEIVNNWVARALPTLTHQQMLQMTKAAEVLKFDPGQTIIQQDQPADRFYIVSKGAAEVVLKRQSGNDVVVSRMTAGQYFGEIELFRDRRAIASVRAAELPLEVLAIEHASFDKLVAESEAMHDQIEDIVLQRERENRQTRKRPPS
jgi:putative ABC transport system ATP-binding protein